MTTKTKAKGKVKVGRLDLNKETIKNLTHSESKKIKGGVEVEKDRCPTCPQIGTRATSKGGLA